MRVLEVSQSPSTNGTKRRVMVGLSQSEIDAVVEAVQIVRREIDEVEFSTRLGVGTGGADALIKRLTTGGSAVWFSDDDLLLFNNALNEVLHGLPELDERPIRPDRRLADALLDEVGPLVGRPVAITVPAR